MFWKFLLPLLLATANARAETITLSNGEWLPYLSEHLPRHGAVSRIVSEAFAREGVTVKYVFRPWPRAYAEAQRGLVQGSIVWSRGAEDSQRNREFLFSDVVLESKSVFFHRKGFNFRLTRDEDLLAYKVGGVIGYDYRFESVPGLRIDRAASDELSMRKLAAGRIDVFPASLDVGLYIIRTRLTPQEAARITSAGRYAITHYHLIMPRHAPGSARLIERFNSGLRKLKEEGKFDQYMADIAAGRY
jgi:polar amino acid transport system substrate-binding protein